MKSGDYDRVEQAIRYLEAAYPRQPALGEVAESVGLSPSHFQRVFSRWAGVSPKRFLQFLAVEHAKRLLQEKRTVLETTYDVGLSSQGRLHDLFVSVEAVTPGEYKSFGNGLEIRYGFCPTPFGECLLATTDRGICQLMFVDEDERERALKNLAMAWENAEMREDSRRAKQMSRQVFGQAATSPEQPLHVFLRGTNFQLKVWNALLRIPAGGAVSYSELANHLGCPTASRAVGTAIGSNRIGYLIPCHRVLRRSGHLGGYRWGTTRKRAMLAWESCRNGCGAEAS